MFFSEWHSAMFGMGNGWKAMFLWALQLALYWCWMGNGIGCVCACACVSHCFSVTPAVTVTWQPFYLNFPYKGWSLCEPSKTKGPPCIILYVMFIDDRDFVLYCIVYSPEGRPGDFWCLPPVWNLGAASLIPLFYISCLVFLPSPVALSVLSFSAFGPSSWSVFPKPPFSEM